MLGAIGERFTDAADRFGQFWTFGAHTALWFPVEILSPRGWRRLLPQCFAIGAMSVPVIMLTGAFIGMVLIVQGWPQFEATGMTDRLGAIVNASLAVELGPVLAGVMLAGRVGGALTAELGTMNVTEQLLALRSMGTDPIRYLATPRFIACLVLTPLLTCYAALVGALGAWIIYAAYYGGDSEPYWRNTAEILENWDLGTGLVKSLFFGGTIGLVSCYKGFHCRPGAEGVGRACTQSFVISFMIILVLDFFLGLFINKLYETWYGFRPLI
ncbi:MAG: ABC transporter permease [Planctomycetes bacterium]|nr:ABC transporter permease [Planctomycetota bacterium]